MEKAQLGPTTLVYPMPVLLVGAYVDGQPNFMAVAWGGIANGEPPMVSVAIRMRRHTYRGIKQAFTFSVNIPSVDQAREADYCGLASGADVDKVRRCGFEIFTGALGTAPLISQCPVNLECSVVHILALGSHALVIGKVEETHVSKECLTDGRPDVSKIRPLVFAGEPDRQYQESRNIAKAFSVGRDLGA